MILITTKKGKEGRVRVNYSNSTTFSHPFVMPKFQNTYGTSEIEPMMSWGSKLATPTSYDPADFFQTGFNETNSVGLSAGTERNQTYASASAVNSRGIVPNNVYNRYNFSIRNTTMLIKDRLTLDVGATYMKQYTRNQTVQGQYRNPLVGIYLFPRGNDIRKYEIYERPGSDSRYMEQFWDLEFLKGVENPWWITNRELNENRQHRYSFNATMKLDITDWMSLTGRIRTDNATINYTRKLSASTNTLFASKYGSYLNRTMTHNNLYGDVLLSIDKSFCDNAFSLQFNLGASIMDNKNQLTGYEGYLAGIPNKFTYNNIISDNSQSFPTQENYHDQIQAVYATMQLGWRGMALRRRFGPQRLGLDAGLHAQTEHLLSLGGPFGRDIVDDRPLEGGHLVPQGARILCRGGQRSRTLHHRSQLHADQRRRQHGDHRPGQAPRSRAHQVVRGRSRRQVLGQQDLGYGDLLQHQHLQPALPLRRSSQLRLQTEIHQRRQGQ